MAENTPSSEAQSPNADVAPTPSSFGDDDLGRIQGILFGDHARKTDERLNVMEIALLGAIADLREETAVKLDAIDSRITAEAETRERAVSNLGSKFGRELAEQTEKVDQQTEKVDKHSQLLKEQTTQLDDLRSEVESVEAGVKKSLETVETTMGKAIADARVEMTTDKVDRTDLATLFRELGDQLGNK